MRNWMAWWYHDAEGGRVFQHYRLTAPNHPRGKRYGYRYPAEVRGRVIVDWNWRKHPDADALVYRLHEVLQHRCDDLWLTEGERDADALREGGMLASAHHGGAGKFTEAQAESLAGHRGEITIVADRDVPGAYCAVQRFDLLRDVGIPTSRLRVVRADVAVRGADARDHLAAGYRLRDFVSLDVGMLRELARRADVSIFVDSGYEIPNPLSDPLADRWFL